MITLASTGNVSEVETAKGLEQVRREPPITISPRFRDIRTCESIITTLDYGQFQLASWMIEQMRWNSRVRGVQNTRWDGLIGTEIRWEPGRPNDTARRASRDIVDDFPLIATAATRKQIARWGCDLGVSFSQKHWYESPTSGRMIPRMEHYHPQWAIWDWSLRGYRIWTLDGWMLVPSPSLMVPGQPWEPLYSSTYGRPESLKRWVVHEPFGQHSWREGMIHAAWKPWMGHELANMYLSRGAEKHGNGIIALDYPATTDKTALNLLMQKLRTLGTEGVIPLEVQPEGSDKAGYAARPFEWTSTGFDIIRGAKESNATDLAVLYLGHNTTAETKGASVGASAQVGNLIRGDIRIGDCYNEWATLYGQVIRDWAEVNYGDAGNAPIPIYVTDPPSENMAAATTLFNVAQAIEKLRANVAGIDVSELMNRFRVPQVAGGAKFYPPAPVAAPKAPGSIVPGKATEPSQSVDDDGDEGDDEETSP